MLKEVERMASGDLSRRLEITQARDACDAISFAINILADEVQFRYGQLEMTLAELRETQEKLVQSAKMAALGEFSSGIAHEINNPLALIRIHVDQLQALIRTHGHPVGAQILDGLRKIDANVDRMARTTKHVQDFSRPAKSAKTAIPLNRVVAASVELTAEQLRMKKIAVVMNLSTADPLVHANFNALEHVMLNLISNARDSFEGVSTAAEITIATNASADAAIVSVSDNGAGLAPGAREKVFDPFFTTKPPGHGTGLGLSISLRIIKDHGGSISCFPNPVSGTTFEVRLPFAESFAESEHT